MASRKIDDLELDVRIKALDLLSAAREKGIDLLITCTYRSPAEQEALYRKGRTEPGLIVTNARAGQSLHNLELKGIPAARAFDIVPLVNGKPLWKTEGKAAELWSTIGELGESLGLEWGGRWRGSLIDMPHFQIKKKE